MTHLQSQNTFITDCIVAAREISKHVSYTIAKQYLLARVAAGYTFHVAQPLIFFPAYTCSYSDHALWMASTACKWFHAWSFVFACMLACMCLFAHPPSALTCLLRLHASGTTCSDFGVYFHTPTSEFFVSGETSPSPDAPSRLCTLQIWELTLHQSRYLLDRLIWCGGKPDRGPDVTHSQTDTLIPYVCRMKTGLVYVKTWLSGCHSSLFTMNLLNWRA